MQRIGFWLGVCLFVLLMALDPPDGLSLLGWRTAAVTVLMATWWFTEAVLNPRPNPNWRPPPPITMAGLPEACRQVLVAR